MGHDKYILKIQQEVMKDILCKQSFVAFYTDDTTDGVYLCNSSAIMAFRINRQDFILNYALVNFKITTKLKDIFDTAQQSIVDPFEDMTITPEIRAANNKMFRKCIDTKGTNKITMWVNNNFFSYFGNSRLVRYSHFTSKSSNMLCAYTGTRENPNILGCVVEMKIRDEA